MPVQRKAAYLLIAVIALVVILAYFGRPRPPLLEIVTPRQELPNFQEHYPGDSGLADRVAKSYGLALVLFQSPYTEKNLIALESLRSWARERFQKQPDFLHPFSLEPSDEPRETVVESFFYNLFASPLYWLEERVGDLLKVQVANFHQTRAYASFRAAYFDLFGVDADSAILLARYQSERAKLAVGVVLWSLSLLMAVVVAAVSIVSAGPGGRFDRLQRVLSYGWLLLGACYLVVAWTQNQVSVLISALVCALIGVFLRYPFRLARSEGAPWRFESIVMRSNWVALALWLSYSLLAIQVWTWVHSGTLNDPDPVTLLLSSLSGNFLQDPANGKRLIVRALGLSWILIGLWTAGQASRDAKAARETEERLASLGGPS